MPPTPVSTALEADVLAYARKHGVTVWLDRDGQYSAFAADLAARQAAKAAAGERGVPVVAHRGSFIETLLALDGLAEGHTQEALIVHVPGYTEETILETPLLELYEVGTRYRMGLDRLVELAAAGRVAPAEVADVLARPGLTLADADAWLAGRMGAARGDLAAFLDTMGLLAVTRDLLVDDRALRARMGSPEDVAAVAEYLERQTGMDAAWRQFFARGASDEALAEPYAGWLLAVEYVWDLRREAHLPELRRLKALPRPVVQVCQDLVLRLREEVPDRYGTMADEVEVRLAEEIAAIAADDLGRIDTFRTEERRVLEAAIADLRAGRFRPAEEKATARTVVRSFWLARDRERRNAWALVEQAARFGLLLEDRPRPLHRAAGHEDAARLYAEQAAAVDAAHRAFEQLRARYLVPGMPSFAEFKEVVDDLRRRWRAWADALGRDFTQLCRDHGVQPPAGLQQRTLYEQVVAPLLSDPADGRVAVVAVDALRFEMAQALAAELKGPGLTVDLKPRYAELPTLTAVGMNVLAPVAQGGRLSPVLSGGKVTGFRTGEFTVRDIDSRARAMMDRSTGRKALALSLAEVVAEPVETLKRRVAQTRLLYVHGREIDDAGEADLGLATFEQSLTQLRAACVHLLDAGVKHLVITADHGFLLVDPAAPAVEFGNRREPERRHVFSDQPRTEGGLLAVSLAGDLGWEGASGYVLFRDDTAVFAAGPGGGSFIHGGNSLQERLVPVLTVTRRREKPVSRTAYAITAEALAPERGAARLRLSVATAQGANESLGFAAPARVALALRVPGRDDVRVVIKDTGGPSLQGDRILLRPGVEVAEVLFLLEGPRDERVRVEVWHPDAAEAVAPLEAPGWFDVAGTAPARATDAAVAPPPADDWAERIVEEGARRIFLHIAEYGSVDEEEMNRLLGSARAVRRFALAFDGWLPLLPFRVVAETTPRGKRYVKQTGG